MPKKTMKSYFATRSLVMIISLSLGLCLVDSATVAENSLHGKIASRTISLVANKHVVGKNDQRRRGLMIRESLRVPKLLPGDGVISEMQEEAQRKQNELEQDDNGTKNCDIAFYDCLTSSACTDCFYEMKSKDIDWTGVTENTDCDVVVPILTKAGICTRLPVLEKDKQLFCDAFHACVYFDENDDKDEKGSDNEDDKDKIDCSALTECNWPGFHESFVGDGVCHDNYGNSCYNSAVCNWDGGDCCKDTCKSEKGSYLQCGTDGFSCRNPNSTDCDPSLTVMCPSDKKNNNEKEPPKCDKEKTLYRLDLFDSFGDGWEGTSITITAKNGGAEPIYTGALENGSQGTEYLCLSVEPTCYSVEVSGGMWGREASWDIRGYADGSPVVASGGGSVKCEFMVAGQYGSGDDCQNTCTGKNNVEPNTDPDYKDFKDMVHCINDKCVIQAEACRADPACQKCFDEDVPEYCFSISAFNAVTECSICKCFEGDADLNEFCDKKAAPGLIPIKPAYGGQDVERQCTPAEVLEGSTAIIDFSLCMHESKDSFMIADFDENNFGDLDTFEACAHSFQAKDDHGGHTALGCMQILVNAINAEAKPGEPTEAISELASLLYNEGPAFCDCAKKASDECPLCPAFYNFKTLLYESLDACQSLDEIDCAAWDEFQAPCKVNLMSSFGSVNLRDPDQCDYMTSNCGGVGPFPSFRRLDCKEELPEGSWDFYEQFEKFCYQDSETEPSAPVPAPIPVPAPVPAPTRTVTTKAPTPYEPVKPSFEPPPSGKKPYVPPEDRGKPTYKSPDEKKSSHWFRNLVLISLAGGIGYFIYKRQSEFSFVRYRRIGGMGGGFGLRGFGGGGVTDDGDMYSGLSLESSTNFEPPSLPPTPMSMPNNGGYGA